MASHPSRAAEVIAKSEASSASAGGSFVTTILGFIGLGKKSKTASVVSTPQVDPEAAVPEDKEEAPAPEPRPTPATS